MSRVRSGNHTFLNCKSHSDSLVNQLEALSLNINLALVDLETPQDSPSFKAFFKNPDHASFVRRALENVTTGAANPALNDRTMYPTFVCIDAPGQVISTDRGDMHTICDDRHGPFASATLEDPTKPIMTLCPRFFSLPIRLQKPYPGSCLELGSEVGVHGIPLASTSA
ncbi:MAG: hypothetical protein Q9169_006928 [Polycauliona sp. 2 TL-2023]